MQVHEQVTVGVKDVAEPIQGVEVLSRLVRGLGHQQVADRPHDDGADLRSGLLGLADLVRDGGVDVVNGGGGVDLGNQVVVVGVEPLGHLQGGTGALTSGQREVALDVQGTAGVQQVAETSRHGPQGGGDLEDLVVEGEVRGHRRGLDQPQVRQARAGRPAQLGSGVSQLVDAQVPLPEGLHRAFELAVPTDAGIAQDGGPRQGGRGDLRLGHGDLRR